MLSVSHGPLSLFFAALSPHHMPYILSPLVRKPTPPATTPSAGKVDAVVRLIKKRWIELGLLAFLRAPPALYPLLMRYLEIFKRLWECGARRMMKDVQISLIVAKEEEGTS